MRQTEVALVGGGLAGSLAAAMLGRAGIPCVLIDPHTVYPPDFRCEKLDGNQMATLALTGLAGAVKRVSTPDRNFWMARHGRVILRRGGDQRGVMYDTLVNTVRGEIPANVEIVHAKAREISRGAEQQTVTLSNGETISPRLVVLATGLNAALREKLGITRRVLSANHSVSIGFDVKPVGRTTFPFSSFTYYADSPSQRMCYLTLFPIGSNIRANLFGYRDLHDPWLKQLRDAPRETLLALWPRLEKIMGPFEVTSFVQIRPVDLYVTDNRGQDGVVLVGDAFSTSCPAAGNGARKVLVDVERLCNVHIPRWLATPGMNAAKLATFYEDPVKLASDARSEKQAFDLRSFSIDPSVQWTLRRAGRFTINSTQGVLNWLTAPARPLGDFDDEADSPGLSASPSAVRK